MHTAGAYDYHGRHIAWQRSDYCRCRLFLCTDYRSASIDDGFLYLLLQAGYCGRLGTDVFGPVAAQSVLYLEGYADMRIEGFNKINMPYKKQSSFCDAEAAFVVLKYKITLLQGCSGL